MPKFIDSNNILFFFIIYNMTIDQGTPQNYHLY